jgi:hypothetical protein
MKPLVLSAFGLVLLSLLSGALLWWVLSLLEPPHLVAKYGVTYEKTWGEHEEYQTIWFHWNRHGKKIDGPMLTGDDLYVSFLTVNGTDVPEIVVKSETDKSISAIFKLNFSDGKKPEFELVQNHRFNVRYPPPWSDYYETSEDETEPVPTATK